MRCVISQEDIQPPEPHKPGPVLTPCKHTFHFECLRKLALEQSRGQPAVDNNLHDEQPQAKRVKTEGGHVPPDAQCRGKCPLCNANFKLKSVIMLKPHIMHGAAHGEHVHEMQDDQEPTSHPQLIYPVQEHELLQLEAQCPNNVMLTRDSMSNWPHLATSKDAIDRNQMILKCYDSSVEQSFESNSPKIEALIAYFKSMRAEDSTGKAIVFVKQSHVMTLLVDVLKKDPLFKESFLVLAACSGEQAAVCAKQLTMFWSKQWLFIFQINDAGFSHASGFNLTAANHVIFVAPGELASDLNWKLRIIGRVQHTRGVASH